MKNLGIRIKEVRTELGLSQTQFAKSVGLSQATVSDIEAGHTLATRAIGKIATLANVNVYWLETGKGEKRSAGQKAPAALKPNESVFDVFDVRAACGDGIINPDHPEIVRRLIMPSEKALELIGSTNRNGQIRVIVAAKDSMVPTIKPNDLLFVDTSVNEYKGEAVYILIHGGEFICKRLQLLGKTITVTSDNDRYLPWQWDDRPEETQIIGKVLRALPLNFTIFGN